DRNGKARLGKSQRGDEAIFDQGAVGLSAYGPSLLIAGTPVLGQREQAFAGRLRRGTIELVELDVLELSGVDLERQGLETLTRKRDRVCCLGNGYPEVSRAAGVIE